MPEPVCTVHSATRNSQSADASVRKCVNSPFEIISRYLLKGAAHSCQVAVFPQFRVICCRAFHNFSDDGCGGGTDGVAHIAVQLERMAKLTSKWRPKYFQFRLCETSFFCRRLHKALRNGAEENWIVCGVMQHCECTASVMATRHVGSDGAGRYFLPLFVRSVLFNFIA